MEFVLPDWFYQGVLDRRLVLTIDPVYFRLTGGIERWLYRVARKHAGRQPDGWRFDLRHLHAKSASQARFSDFALDLRRIVNRQPLPGYDLALEHDGDGRALIAMRPRPSWPAVDKPGRDAPMYRDFGRTSIGISGASISGFRAQADSPASQLSLGFRDSPADSNLPNVESNFVVGAVHAGGKRRSRRGGAS